MCAHAWLPAHPEANRTLYPAPAGRCRDGRQTLILPCRMTISDQDAAAGARGAGPPALVHYLGVAWILGHGFGTKVFRRPSPLQAGLYGRPKGILDGGLPVGVPGNGSIVPW